MKKIIFGLILLILTTSAASASWPGQASGDYIIDNFTFDSGETLPKLKLHYRTLGTPKRDSSGNITNAVMMLHGTTSSGVAFLTPSISDKLFIPGAPLDLSEYYIILPDSIGAGGSSKPSDGMRANFPHYRYNDMVHAQYRLLTEKLGVKHLRLIVGYSSGGLLSWVWGEKYPDMMDALLPIVSLPVSIRGRELVIRSIVANSIKSDPAWNNGNYTRQPPGWTSIYPVMGTMGTSPQYLERTISTINQAKDFVAGKVKLAIQSEDANNILYMLEASEDYNPEPALEAIKAKVFAVNFADDQVNPDSRQILEKEMPRVENGQFVIIPASDETLGHSSFLLAQFWGPYVVKLLEEDSTNRIP